MAEFKTMESRLNLSLKFTDDSGSELVMDVPYVDEAKAGPAVAGIATAAVANKEAFEAKPAAFVSASLRKVETLEKDVTPTAQA